MSLGGLAYLDSSAIVKLAVPEPESIAFGAWRTDRHAVTSLVAITEVLRAVRRERDGSVPFALSALDRIARIPVDDDLVMLAAELRPPALRSLDALHLATALALRDVLDAFVTYDGRLADAARDAGLPVVVPR